MNAPVTRGELKEELRLFRQEIKQEIAEALKPYPTRQEMFDEMARMFRAMEESLRETIRISLEPHRDIPPRVTALEDLPPRLERLETAVFPPPAPAKRSRRRS